MIYTKPGHASKTLKIGTLVYPKEKKELTLCKTYRGTCQQVSCHDKDELSQRKQQPAYHKYPY